MSISGILLSLRHFDFTGFIQTAGLLGIFFIVFAESGLFLGFFLPGDSLLVTAGLLASQGYWNIAALIIVCFIAAVSGDSFGYMFGKRVGQKLFSKKDSFLFNTKNLHKAELFYKRHGAMTIVFARFIPTVRTFVPIMAGIADMDYSVFLFYNVAGGFFWAVGLPLLGYYLGKVVPSIDRYILPLIGGIIITSFLIPLVIGRVVKKRP